MSHLKNLTEHSALPNTRIVYSKDVASDYNSPIAVLSPHLRTPNPGLNPGFTPPFLYNKCGGKLRVKPGVWRPEIWVQVIITKPVWYIRQKDSNSRLCDNPDESIVQYWACGSRQRNLKGQTPSIHCHLYCHILSFQRFFSKRGSWLNFFDFIKFDAWVG
jgi:hypothetical protein